MPRSTPFDPHTHINADTPVRLPITADTDFVQSFIDFPPPPAAQVGFDSSTAVVVNGALSAYRSAHQLGIVFSKLDSSVQTELREQRARQAWALFV